MEGKETATYQLLLSRSHIALSRTSVSLPLLVPFSLQFISSSPSLNLNSLKLDPSSHSSVEPKRPLPLLLKLAI